MREKLKSIPWARGLVWCLSSVMGALIVLGATFISDAGQADKMRHESVRLAAIGAYSEANAAAMNYASLREWKTATDSDAQAALAEWRVSFQRAFGYALTEDMSSPIAHRLNEVNGTIADLSRDEAGFPDVWSKVLNVNVAICKKLDPSAKCILGW